MNTNSRFSNMELLRIISMLLIILFHCSFCAGDGTWLTAKFDINHVWAICFQSWGIVGVHCFFFINAYWGLEKDSINWKKIYKVFFTTIFYAVFMWWLSYIYGSAGMKELVKSVLSPISGVYWFVSTYIVMCILSPYLNIILNSMANKKIVQIIGILGVLVFGIKTFFNINLFGDISLAVFDYFLIGYVKLYGGGRLSRKRCLIAVICLCNITIIADALILWAGDYWNLMILRQLSVKLIGRFSFVQLGIGFFLFLYFSQIKIRNYKVINVVASTTFAVYLMHANPYFQTIMWNKILKIPEAWQKSVYLPHIFASTFFVYIICMMADLLRQMLIKVAQKCKCFWLLNNRLNRTSDT